MRRAPALIAFIVAATLAAVAGPTLASSKHAHDLIVYGHVENQNHDFLDDLGLDVLITARLTITRSVKGQAPSSVLTIKYIAHSDLDENRDFRLHLRPGDDQAWLVCNDHGGRGYVCR